MFGPLMFPNGGARDLREDASRQDVHCPMCHDLFPFPERQEDLLKHVLETHRVVIADVDDIPDLPKYLKFWRSQLLHSDVKQYCSTMLVDEYKDGEILKNQEYFLLSDVLPMDRELRKGLAKEQLEKVVEQKTKEREDRNYSHGCLFCRQEVSPTRAEYLNHLSSKHNLQLGQPDNLVYIDKYLTIIEEKIENLQCIFCEKFFKDRNVLKEHMRKKQHKRVNPNNKLYDQFYMVNYLQDGSKNERHRNRKDSLEDEDPSDWSDWVESDNLSIVCLFCEEACRTWENTMEHMELNHRFSYERHASDLTFYEQVKLVNYIRRQVYKNRCVTCDTELDSNKSLLEHMDKECHLFMPDKKLWDQPEYYFPTYENDSFLCQIDDTLLEFSSELDVVTSEDPRPVEEPVSVEEEVETIPDQFYDLLLDD